MRRFTCYSEATPEQLKLARAESDLAEQRLFTRMRREIAGIAGPGPDNGFERIEAESDRDCLYRAQWHGVSLEPGTIQRPESEE